MRRSTILAISIVSSACGFNVNEALAPQAIPPPDLPVSTTPPPSDEDEFTRRMLDSAPPTARGTATQSLRPAETQSLRPTSSLPAAFSGPLTVPGQGGTDALVVRTAAPPTQTATTQAPSTQSPVTQVPATQPPAGPAESPIPPTLNDFVALTSVLANAQRPANKETEQILLAQLIQIEREARPTRHSSDAVPPRPPTDEMLLEQFLAMDIASGSGGVTWPCGAAREHLVICPTKPDPRPHQEYHLIGIITKAAFPKNDPKGLYTFGFVLDRDGRPENDFKPDPAFPNDFYTGTDRWYEVSYAPKGGWTLDITSDALTGQRRAESGARALMRGNALMLLIPAAELPPGARFRATTFRHTGDFGMAPPHDWSGDVFPRVGQPLLPFRGTRVALP